nr:MAG TPA: hypothetical protein [Caudoviricetes sp.]
MILLTLFCSNIVIFFCTPFGDFYTPFLHH